MTSPIRISAKNLGKLSLGNYCERCFWILSHMGFRAPWSIFPGIFSSLDSHQKKVAHAFFDKHGQMPPWFSALGHVGVPIPVPHHSQFQYHDRATDILLTGAPDEMLRLPDGRIQILDFKTSMHSDGQDSLLPMYRTQLNGYALIAESLGMGQVAGLSLVYFEPPENVSEAEVDGVVKKDGFLMRFRVDLVAIELDLQTIPPLLRRARTILDSPAPAPAPNCRDCALLTDLIRLETACC